MKRKLLTFGFLLVTLVSMADGREIKKLDKWNFYPAYDVSKKPAAVEVTVPHSWNLEDVFDGMKYDRSTYVYEYVLNRDAASLQGKRAFLKFEGVNTFAEVAVNREFVGTHAGGYTAFCFEITDKLKVGDNKITVVASNAYRTDVAPLAGDFNMYGGIIRPVSLIVTGEDCISPLDYASSGVYVHQDKISEKQADITIETMLSLNNGMAGKSLHVWVSDKEGNVVAEETTTDTRVKLSIKSPHLWDGRNNPYLYKVFVELLDNGKVIDRIEETTGVRYFSLDAEKGFFLNGKYLDLYGVCRHEEYHKTGNLYNEDAMREDADIITELGCTGVRFVHYPHSPFDVRQYDERGLVAWQELNLAGPGGYNSPGYMKNPRLEANVMQNLVEMIKQNYNSPSICFWSLCNELSFKYDEPATFLRLLNEKAKQLDPSRLTTLAICYDQEKFQGITDCIGWNKYFGYYESKGGVGEFMDNAKQVAGNIPIGLCEYGAAGSHLQHGLEKIITNRIHFEENQARVHEENWRDMYNRRYAWCKFIWQYADNPSSIRDEGDAKGMNDKGIVTHDRKVRKDAYYFYKANWSSEPVLYISARRYTQRADSVTDVKVYTNRPHATLYLNGKRVAKAKKDEIGRVVFKNVKLAKGDNIVEVKAGKLIDRCVWNLSDNNKRKTTIKEEKLDGAVN